MRTTSHRRRLPGAAAAALAAVAVSAAITGLSAAAANAAPVPNPLGHVPDKTVASLIAPNGDRDPFGIAVVPLTSGDLTAGNLLVAEFSDKNGTVGAGTTILQVNPVTGATSAFFQGAPVAGPVGIAINPANDGVLDR